MSRRDITRRDFIDRCAFGAAAFGLAGMGGVERLTETVGGLALQQVGNVSRHPGLYWRRTHGMHTICDLCPSLCEIQPGERGTCGVRENINGAYTSMVYARPCEIRVDPMEKGPFFHYLAGTRTLALGTAGCNLDCKYCQSAAFAKARPEATNNKTLSPQGLVSQLRRLGYRSVTFTFSEPMIAIEYVLDVAKLARPAGIKVAVHTAAWFNSIPMEDMCKAIDAINIDLKAYCDDFYRNVTGGTLEPVLNNIRRVRRHDHLWLELTNLVIPGYNDREAQFAQMCRWIIQNCGADTPLHVAKFFPAYKMRNVPPTPNETLRGLRRVAYDSGLRYVYLGNMPGDPGESTFCPKCGVRLVHRNNYQVNFTSDFNPRTGLCTKCNYRIPGIWT